jgi:hypothetical protein
MKGGKGLVEHKEFNSISYYKFIAEKKLMASKCKKCGALYLPPRPLCIQCYHNEMEWAQMSGEGKLAAYTAISVPPSFMAAEGYGRNNPYCVGVVELTEGPKVCSRILGVNPKSPEEIQIGTKLQAEFLEKEEGETKKYQLAFKPVST